MHVALILTLVVGAHAYRRFNITDFVIPPVLPPGQTEAIIECRYEGEFTLLNFFKGPSEFFRYSPRSVPTTRTFSILGVGKIEMLECGPTICRLRLGSLTEEASGLYRCDIERETPSYKFETRKADMIVRGIEHSRPQLQGVAEEYGEGDRIMAYCRGVRGFELRWYINGREIVEMRGSPMLNYNSSRLIFMGVPPTISIQCAEFHNNVLLGSKEVKAKWNQSLKIVDRPEEQRNGCTRSFDMFTCTLLINAWTIIKTKYYDDKIQ